MFFKSTRTMAALVSTWSWPIASVAEDMLPPASHTTLCCLSVIAYQAGASAC